MEYGGEGSVLQSPLVEIVGAAWRVMPGRGDRLRRGPNDGEAAVVVGAQKTAFSAWGLAVTALHDFRGQEGS